MERNGVMTRYREVEVSGRPRDLGRQIGDAAGEEVRRFCSIALDRVNQTMRVSRQTAVSVAEACLAYAEEYSADAIEELRGLAEACRAFNAPITGGNVSLYNQSPDGAIDPTPTVAMVGLIERPEHIVTQWFKDEGDTILLLGEALDAGDPVFGLGGSAYLPESFGRERVHSQVASEASVPSPSASSVQRASKNSPAGFGPEPPFSATIRISFFPSRKFGSARRSGASQFSPR